MFNGIFGGMFDFDHDGKLNSWEKANEIAFLAMLDEEEEEERRRAEDDDNWDE